MTLAIHDPYTAFCVDQAVFRFGTAVEDAVRDAGEPKSKRDTEKARKSRAMMAFNRMLGIKQKFADPLKPKGV